MIEIEVGASTVDTAIRILESLGKDAAPAVRKSLNKAVSELRKSDVHEEVRDEYNIPISRVKKTIKISKATTNDLMASLTSTGARMPLIRFGARALKKAGVSVHVSKPGGRKKMARQDGNLPFVATMSSGHKGVFVRAKKSRLPINELTGPSVPGMISAERHDIVENIQTSVKVRFEKHLNHEVDQVFRKLGIR